MKKIRFVIIFAVISLLFLLSSCDSARIIRPVDTLLAPPLYHEEYQSLVDAFHEKVDKNVLFCTPKNGDYRSAIVVEDVDSDGQKEAFIFYKETVESSVVRMHYFNIIDGKWASRGDFNGYGNEVEKAFITDMDSDGNSEVIVIWSVSGVSSSSIMSVYRTSYNFDEYKEISNEMCTVCEVVDIDGDSKNEIFYMNQISLSGFSQRFARAIKISGNTVVLMGEAKVDPNISSYTAVKTEKATGESPLKIYVDALKGDRQMITELIYWDKDKSELSAPMLDAETMSNTATLRYEPIASADLNNDGIIDIPVQSELLDKKTEGIYITQWINYSDNQIKKIADTLVNFSDGYMIRLDEGEAEITGIRDYRSQNCWVVFKKNEKNNEEELYSVLLIPEERWNAEDFSAYIDVLEKDDGVVCAYITKNGINRGVTEETILNKITRIP